MYIDRMAKLIQDIGASNLSKADKTEATRAVVYLILSQGEIDGIEFGDSNQSFRPLLPSEKEKDRTAVVRKEVVEECVQLDAILQRAGIEWEGSGVTANEVKAAQAELDRRGLAVA